MNKNIGGVMDYALLAKKHMPADPAVLRAEVCRLAASGLKPMDISVALRMSLPHVLEAIRGAS